MKETRRLSIIIIIIIGTLLSIFVLIRADVFHLLNNNEEQHDTDLDKDEDEDKDQQNNNNNVSPVSNYSTPVITINGDKEVTIELGSVYSDLGAKAYDSTYGNLTSEVVIISDVDTSKLGTYTVTYNVKNKNGKSASAVTRTVKVVDTTSPEIILDDSDDLTVEAQKNGVFVNPTVVTVNDNSKETITPVITYSYYTTDIASAVSVDKVDVTKIGNYIIHYNAIDSNNNAALEVTRTVVVSDSEAPVINFSREGTIEEERNAYLTVNVNDFSTTTTKYIFLSQDMRPSVLDDDDMFNLPENGIINPPSDGTYLLYVHSVDAFGNESSRTSEGLFNKNSEVTDEHSIISNNMNLSMDQEDDYIYSYIDYDFVLNNFEDGDIVKLISKLYSGATLLATNTVMNDDLIDINNPYQFLNKFIISTSTIGLGTYMGDTVNNTMTGYTGGLIPDRIEFEVITLNNGIYYSTLTNSEITPTEWSNALYLSVEGMKVEEIKVGENGLELNVGVNTLVPANTVDNIVVELYSDNNLLATNTANQNYLQSLSETDDFAYLVSFTTTFYLENINTDPNFDTTLGSSGYVENQVPNNVRITVSTSDDQNITNNINLNLSNEQIDNWNSTFISG